MLWVARASSLLVSASSRNELGGWRVAKSEQIFRTPVRVKTEMIPLPALSFAFSVISINI